MKNQILGSQGEQAAADFLQQQGYRICARNFRVPVGEIDIIARQGEVLAFVEVKTRHSNRYGTPAQAVNIHKQKKIIQTAQWFLRQKHLEDKCYQKAPEPLFFKVPGLIFLLCDHSLTTFCSSFQ